MAIVIPSVTFTMKNTPNRSDVEIAALNFELLDRLGTLEPGSTEYMRVARAFHAEAALR